MGIRHRAGGAASESILTWNRAAVGLECQACKGKAAMHGRSIRIFLATGEVSGVRHAEVVNWTGQAVIAPRRRLAELRGWAEVQRPGVYVLVGESLETGRRQVYVGEAENVATRLADHHRTKDWWETVLVVTSKDANLTKSHVRYLESRMTALAREARRADVENGTEPAQSPLPRPDIAAMEEFLENAVMLCGVLGHPWFEPLVVPRAQTAIPVAPGTPAAVDNDAAATPALDNELLTLQVRNQPWRATGRLLDEGFVVMANSTACLDVADYLNPGWKLLRQSLIDQGALQTEPDRLRFTRDVTFDSISAAAAVVVGGNRNGRELWKDTQGRSVKQAEVARLDAGQG